MRLPEYIKKLTRRQAVQFRKKLIARFHISASYARHLCNGRNNLPSKYAISIEALTNGEVPRYVSAPDHYPVTEYEDGHARICKSITTDMDERIRS
jgi:DNA-binding transcriptional regulator YdaS (Cro superfamily)